jgi:hypothetical protein
VSGAGDKDMALKIYQQCGASGKVLRGAGGAWCVREAAGCVQLRAAGPLAAALQPGLQAAATLPSASPHPPPPRAPPQVIVSLAEKGDMSALMSYTGQSGTSLNYMQLLQQLMMTNPSGAVSLAKMVAKQTPPPAGCDTNSIADLFLQRNMVREATAFLLDALAGEAGVSEGGGVPGRAPRDGGGC